MAAGLYVQVPFCQTKCTYCNFHTGVFPSKLYEPYLAAVLREIEIRSRDAWPEFDTIYVGGGTPSLLEPAGLASLVDSFRDHFAFDIAEATLEADPETVTHDKVCAWREAGFNRISLGAQSFSDIELKAAGRMHRRADIFAAVDLLRAANFENISFDLIAGLPQQSVTSWQDSLDNLLHIAPEHVSVYLMEIDEGSRLGKEVLSGGSRYGADSLPSDDEMASFYEYSCERLRSAGLEHYEISNWALPGFRSRHNLKYWRREPYLGVGAGAHSFDGPHRWANNHDPRAFVAALERGELPVEQLETVTPQQVLEEEIFLGLRQLDGIELASVDSTSRRPLMERINKLRASGLVVVSDGRLRISPDRIAVSNEIFVELLDAVSG